MNYKHNHNRESSARDNTRFFTEVNLFLGKLVLNVAIYPFDGSRANWQFKPNSQRVPHIHSGDPPSHEQFTRVANYDSPLLHAV